jgi:hypothetical protein
MNKERNNKRDPGFLGGGGSYRRLRSIKCQSGRKRQKEKEGRVAWKFDEITNGFKVEARYCFPTHLLHLKKTNIYLYMYINER